MAGTQPEVCINVSDLQDTVQTGFGRNRFELDPEKEAGVCVVISIAH